MKNSKKTEELFDAISDINGSDIEDFAKYDDKLQKQAPAKKERPAIKIIGVAAACLVLFGGISAGLKIAELRMNPNGPAASSSETGDTADETEEIQVKKHVYKNEAPYAELVKYEFTPEEQAYADRYYAEMVENCPEFGKIPREKLWESIPLGGKGDFADFYFYIGSIGTDYGCSCNDHEYGYQEYTDALNGWRISGKEFEQFVDFQLSQTVNDAIIELLKKNVRAYAEENGLQLARFVDRDPDDILERCGFHYDENGLYVQSVSIADSIETPIPHIYAAVGVEINGDTITLTEYPASSELIFVKEDDDYVYTFVPGGGAGDVTKPYLTPEKKAYTKEEQEKIDRCYNEMLEKYPDFGLIPREMLKEDIYYVTTAENNTVVYFTFCIGGIPTGYQFTSDFKDFQVHGEEFKPFIDIALDEYMMSDFRGRLGKETELYMKSEKLDSEHFDKNDLKLSWMIENGMLFLESEYETSVTDKTVKRYESGKVCVYDKIRVYKIPESSTDVYFHTFPAWSEEVPVPDDVTETVTETELITETETEPETDTTDTREYNGRIYAENETFVGEYKTESVSVSVSNVREGDLSYYICDITLSSAEDLRTAFAGNSLSGRDYTSKIAQSAEAGFAVNGDYCGYRKAGIIIREGKLCRDEKAYGWDLCYMDKNGDLIVCKNDEEDGAALLNDDVWQSWCFGPTLVKDHKALSNDEFCAPDISKKDWARESRTAIGQIDALHYIILVVDSKRVSDDIGGWNTVGGMNFDELAAAFEALGCKVAYNLDGGGSTTVYLNGKVVNEPSGESERKISDIIYLK